MQSPGNLNCVPADSVADQFKFDACVGKAEGADCTTYTFSRNDHKSAALYEGKGKCGAEGYCMSASATSCDGKKDGDKCSFEEASGLQMYSRSGTCKQPLLRIYKTQCNESSSKVIGPAKPIKAFDNRPGAPIRNSRMDTCDGTAKTPRDFVKKATVIKQGPASDKLKRPSPAPGSTSSPRSDSTSSSNSSSGGGIPTKWYIIGTILVIKFFLFMAWLMRKEDPKEDEDEDEKAKAAFEPLATAKVHESRATYAVRKYLTPFQVPTTSITDIRHLGTSAFGSCWLVEHESGRQLASKRVAPGVADDTKKLSPFIASVMASAPLRHPQLIEFFGAVWTTANDLQALFEYAPNGDLCAWLHHPNTPRSWSATKFRIARDVLEAMAFAHAANPALVECDITSRKVMLVDGLRAKVRDITGSFYLAATAPSRWTAPEVVTGAARTPQAHMYTFGVLLSELDTHQLPFTDVLGEDTGRMAEEVLARRVAQDLLAPTFTAECPEAIVALARRCLSFTPSERPTVAEAIAVLDDALRMEAGSVM
ncbi:TPA: hypothetical protein N0F65_010811 [Lagenidium giganteum]|uniref:Protein kinase domain-containing protein n=1 Tax=Lagenidium giganteum TaxID=4803 RepID=A0AAV2Z6M8_9STRA|nr:TPA: hypothetical protein N0F65_010811 [Lagenidium giganteum]